MSGQTTNRGLQAAASALANARSVLVTSHPNPDGDAIGSMLAAMHGLRAGGREVYACHPEGVPNSLAFLPGSDEVTQQWPASPVDLTLILDCADDRVDDIGLPGRETLGHLLIVDHHGSDLDIGDTTYRDTDAASVGVMLHRLFHEIEVPITTDVAISLYCSIVSDTGSFRYQNTNAECLRIAAELVARGVEPWAIALDLFEKTNLAQLRLVSRVMDLLDLSPDGKCACVTLTERVLGETGASSEMGGVLAGYARGLEGVEVAALLRPGAVPTTTQRSEVRVSLRSRGKINVAEIAAVLGGGGHPNAAGATVAMPLEAVKQRLFREVSQRVQHHPSPD